jgi:hypothetical protein
VTGPPNASLAIITQDHNFVYAPFERAPPGVTIQTLAALIPEVGSTGEAGGALSVYLYDFIPVTGCVAACIPVTCLLSGEMSQDTYHHLSPDKL